jgi:hypothetical protein
MAKRIVVLAYLTALAHAADVVVDHIAPLGWAPPLFHEDAG